MYSRILSFPFTPYLVIFSMKANKNGRVRFFLISFDYKTDMSTSQKTCWAKHIWYHTFETHGGACYPLCPAMKEAPEACLELLNAPWPPPHTGMWKNCLNSFLNIFPADAQWAGSCKDGGLVLWRQEPAFLAFGSKDWHICSATLWKCICKLNERDNRCFHIISQGN